MNPENTNNDMRTLIVDEVKYRTRLTKKFLNRKLYEPPDPKKIIAIIPGTIRKVFVKPKSRVAMNDELLILEAMKMKNILSAPMDGVIKAVHIKENQSVAKQELLIEFE